MNHKIKQVFLGGLVCLMATMAGCAKVGSERWCKNMEAKPKGDWSMNEAGDYAKHCIIK